VFIRSALAQTAEGSRCEAESGVLMAGKQIPFHCKSEAKAVLHRKWAFQVL
jgi:hypothetical protein